MNNKYFKFPDLVCRFLFPVILAFSATLFAGELPNSDTTPGAITKSVTQDNIHDTICIKGYSASVRPPSWWTSKLKRKLIGPNGNMRNWQLDHLISIDLGGDPNDLSNLWVEPINAEWGAGLKDQLELKLINLVCRGQLPLATAQYEISHDWITAYKKYGGLKYKGNKNEE